jgi:hypothetical protein
MVATSLKNNSCKSDTLACNKRSKAQQAAAQINTEHLIQRGLLQTDRFSFHAWQHVATGSTPKDHW